VLEALRETADCSAKRAHLFTICRLSFDLQLVGRAVYGIGMKNLRSACGQLGLEPSKILSREETLREYPLWNFLASRGVEYYDGQFDDSRLGVESGSNNFDLAAAAVTTCLSALLSNRTI